MATEYIVLKQDENGLWEPLVTLEVDGGQRTAIRRATADVTADGVYVAVPTRSWNPEPIEVEIERKVKFKTAEVEPEPEPQSPGEAVAAADEQASIQTTSGRPLSSVASDDDGA